MWGCRITMLRLIVLTGKFGMGHWAASLSLKQQLERSLGAQVEVVDLFAATLPELSPALYKSFRLLVTYGGGLYNLVHLLTDSSKAAMPSPLVDGLTQRFYDLALASQPDAVIATHPLCAQAVSRLKEEAVRKEHCYLDLPLFTCITDVSSHPEWINSNTDCYLVPDGEVKRSLVEKGVSPARICVTGIPVRQEFRCLSRGGDSPKKGRQLLVMGGGLGLLPMDGGFYETLNGIPGTHTTIITGSNEKLLRHLRGRWENIQVLGYVDRVWEYLEKSDMIVTKPGGITLFESIFAQIPIFSWRPALCQERGNARWLEEQGIGWVAKRADCAGEIREILMDQERLARASARMARVKQQLEVDALSRLMEAIESSREVA